MKADDSQAPGRQIPHQEIVARGIVLREEARVTRDRSRELIEAAAAGDSTRLMREVESLNEALETRTVIANAVGLLMASGPTTRDDAFDQLRRASQRTNRKLRDLAVELVERHEAAVMRPKRHAPAEAGAPPPGDVAAGPIRGPAGGVAG